MAKRDKGDFFWPVYLTTTIRTAIRTVNRTAVRAADIRIVAVFLVSSPFAEGLTTSFTGRPRLHMAAG